MADVLERLERRLEAQNARIEELSNQVFVLADRVDSARVEMKRLQEPPALEVVKLVPDGEPYPSEPTADAGAATETSAAAVDGFGLKLNGDGEPAVIPVVDVRAPVLRAKPKRRGAERSFRDALAAYRQGQVEIAFKRFSRFVRDYPGHVYADNARYWMGECRYDAREYRQAIQQFATVLKRYPGSNKIPDTLLKLGLAYDRLGQRAEARQAFRDLVAAYPRSAVADLARTHLKQPVASGGTR